MTTNATIDTEAFKTIQEAFSQPKTGLPIIDGINALVRPLITFWWVLVLYTSYKAVLIYQAIVEHVSFNVLAVTLVSDFDISVIGAIVGFFFVNRALMNRGSK